MPPARKSRAGVKIKLSGEDEAAEATTATVSQIGRKPQPTYPDPNESLQKVLESTSEPQAENKAIFDTHQKLRALWDNSPYRVTDSGFASEVHLERSALPVELFEESAARSKKRRRTSASSSSPSSPSSNGKKGHDHNIEARDDSSDSDSDDVEQAKAVPETASVSAEESENEGDYAANHFSDDEDLGDDDGAFGNDGGPTF